MVKGATTENKLPKGKNKWPKEINQTNMNHKRNSNGRFRKKKRDFKMVSQPIN